MASMQIKEATAADAPLIASILRAAFVEYESLYTPEAFAATVSSAELIRQRLDEGPIWLAVQDGHAVGTVAAVRKDDGLYMRGMAVIPAARGLGAGARLLAHVCEVAVASRADRVFLSTTPFLADAIRLYQSFGFVRTEDGPNQLYGTPLFTMEKRL
jgi:GNAT superfamily N-acetyltransferase